MKSILQQMYDYHYGGNLENENVNHRIKELERTARTVLENGCPLTTAELAQALIDKDTGKSCSLGCGKATWGRWDDNGDHMHDDGCPFAIAYQVLGPEAEEVIQESMDAAAQAVEMAQSLGIDNAVRIIAQSGKNHDSGPNWYAEFESMQISATFGAGTNSAGVQALVEGKTTVLYSASEYGRHIKTFRTGPWVERLLSWASIVQSNNEAEANRRQSEDAKAAALNFKDVDF